MNARDAVAPCTGLHRRQTLRPTLQTRAVGLRGQRELRAGTEQHGVHNPELASPGPNEPSAARASVCNRPALSARAARNGRTSTGTSDGVDVPIPSRATRPPAKPG